LCRLIKVHSKKDQMPQLTLIQLKYESDTWKRLLGIMIDENIHLKTRLVEILKCINDKNLLEEMENFHSRFIKEDELIGLLRHQIAELDQLMAKEIYEDLKIKNEINGKSKTLRDNISIAESKFTKLKLEFSDFISEMLNENNRQYFLSKTG